MKNLETSNVLSEKYPSEIKCTMMQSEKSNQKTGILKNGIQNFVSLTNKCGKKNRNLKNWHLSNNILENFEIKETNQFLKNRSLKTTIAAKKLLNKLILFY